MQIFCISLCVYDAILCFNRYHSYRRASTGLAVAARIEGSIVKILYDTDHVSFSAFPHNN